MSKKIIFALIILALTTVVLMFNMNKSPVRVDLDLVVTTINNVYKSVAYLGFTLIGVVIGLLLK